MEKQKMKIDPFSTETHNYTVTKMAMANKSCRYTYADYLTWDDDFRCELIDGFVCAFTTPWTKHAEVKVNLASLIFWYIEKRKYKYEAFLAPFDFRLSPTGETVDDKIYNVVQPDICVICDLSKLDERGCIGAPDLIVEILSPCTGKRDFNEKFHLYETTGVREYWIVYPYDMAINVFILQENGKYDEGTMFRATGKVPVHIFEGLEIDLEELFLS
jgi:Uma2 family endonuclease